MGSFVCSNLHPIDTILISCTKFMACKDIKGFTYD